MDQSPAQRQWDAWLPGFPTCNAQPALRKAFALLGPMEEQQVTVARQPCNTGYKRTFEYLNANVCISFDSQAHSKICNSKIGPQKLGQIELLTLGG